MKPKCFRHFNDPRVVLDLSEVPNKTRMSLRSRILAYSHDKSGYTVKVLLGDTPSGMISFVSELYGGKANYNCITERSGTFIPLLASNKCCKGGQRFYCV